MSHNNTIVHIHPQSREKKGCGPFRRATVLRWDGRVVTSRGTSRLLVTRSMTEKGRRRVRWCLYWRVLFWLGACLTTGAAFTSPATQTSILPCFKQLQNQFDIRGVSIHTAKSNVTFSTRDAYYIAAGFSRWVVGRGGSAGGAMVVGFDSRLTSRALGDAALQGMSSVMPPSSAYLDLGLCSTPSVFHACQPQGLSAAGGIMITASHLPFDRNGMKLFTPMGGVTAGELSEVLEQASRLYVEDEKSGRLAVPGARGGVEHWRAAKVPGPLRPWKSSYVLDVYGSHLMRLLREGVGAEGDLWHRPLSGLKILVNAGNGAGGFFARLLQQCGADTGGSLYLEPDGRFPNHPPNPENAVAMRRTAEAVAARGADLGVVFDTDVDRVGFVQGGSRVTALNRNRLIALAAAIALREHPGTTIVTDSVSSLGVAKFIKARGGRHLRYMKGYQNVIQRAKEEERQGRDCQLAIECSGHAAFKSNQFSDDGCYLAVKLVVELARARRCGEEGGFEALITDLDEPVESEELRLPVRPGHDRGVVTAQLLEAFSKCVADMEPAGWTMEEENYEGLRATVVQGESKAGWLHFRPSLHDPVISLTLESDSPGGIRSMLTVLRERVAAATALDWSAVDNY